MKNFILKNKLFMLSLVLLSIWYVDVWENSNTCSRVLPIATYFEQGNFILNKYKDRTIDISVINGNYYMDKAPLPTLITIPFFGLLKWLGIVKSEQGSYYGKAIYIVGAILCGIIPFIIILMLFINTLIKQHREELILMAVVSLLGSFIFVFSGTFFAHVLAAAFILNGYMNYSKNNFFVYGIFCGLAFITEYTTLWIFLSWLLIDLFRNRNVTNIMHALLGFSPSLIFILGYNYYFTGSPFKMLYLFVADNFVVEEKNTYGLSFPKLNALCGLIFSESRGVLYFAPVLVYALYTILTNKLILARIKISSILLHPVLLPFLLTLLFISSHAAWEGGWSYGPRHLTAVTCLLIFYFVQSKHFGKNKVMFWLTSGFGLLCSLFAKITVVYSVPELNQNILGYLIAKLRDPLNEGNLFTLLTYQPAVYGCMFFIVFIGILFLKRPTRKSVY